MSLLDSASEDLNHAVDDGVRIEALTRIAVYLARRGDVEAARAAISRVRTESSSRYYTLAIAGANLAEGVLAFCDVEFEAAEDKFKRAIAMSDSIRASRLNHWSEAWYCHVESCLGRFGEVARRAASLFERLEADEHCSLSRAAATVAVTLHQCDDYRTARDWYEISRRHAVAEGDDLTIDVTLHNIAAYHLNNLRVSEIDSELEKRDIDRASLELESSINYDRIKSPSSFRWMLPLLDIHLALLKGQMQSASERILAWLEAWSHDAPTRLVKVLIADLAWCHARLGQVDEAVSRLKESVSAIPSDSANDDLAILNFRCSQVAHLANMPAEAARFLEASKSSLEAFRAQQRLYGPMFAAIPKPARYGLP